MDHTHTHSRLLWPRHTSFCCTACEACGQSTHLLCCFVLGLPHCRRGGGCLLCLQPLSNCSCRMATLHEPASWRNVSSVALRCLMMAKKIIRSFMVKISHTESVSSQMGTVSQYSSFIYYLQLNLAVTKLQQTRK